MADKLYKVIQGMVGDNFVHRPGDIIPWEAEQEIPALLEAGILEAYIPEPVKTETPEGSKAKKKESR